MTKKFFDFCDLAPGLAGLVRGAKAVKIGPPSPPPSSEVWKTWFRFGTTFNLGAIVIMIVPRSPVARLAATARGPDNLPCGTRRIRRSPLRARQIFAECMRRRALALAIPPQCVRSADRHRHR